MKGTTITRASYEAEGYVVILAGVASAMAHRLAQRIESAIDDMATDLGVSVAGIPRRWSES